MQDVITIAPGVVAERYAWGWWLKGRRDALLKAGLIEPEWIPDGVERHANGCAKRTRNTVVGGSLVKAELVGRSTVAVRYVSHDWCPSWAVRHVEQAARRRFTGDGRAKCAWADCAWQPTWIGLRRGEGAQNG